MCRKIHPWKEMKEAFSVMPQTENPFFAYDENYAKPRLPNQE